MNFNILKHRLIFWTLAISGILLIPLIGMTFSSEVDWSTMDFLVAGILLTGTVGIGELINAIVKDSKRRILLIILLVLTLAIIWGELAVGLFGSPFAGS